MLFPENYSAHTPRITRKFLNLLEVPLFFTASASFKCLLVEVVFAALKGKDCTSRFYKDGEEETRMKHPIGDLSIVTYVCHHELHIGDA